MHNSPIVIGIQKLHPDAVVPSYAHPGDAGADLTSIEPVHLEPGERALVATGIAVVIPHGYVGLVHPRSGLAVKQGLALVNSPGTIDAGYRGEVKVCVINLDPQQAIDLPSGTRIAQLVIQQVELVDFVVRESLDDTDRGSGGFGSTGVSS